MKGTNTEFVETTTVLQKDIIQAEKEFQFEKKVDNKRNWKFETLVRIEKIDPVLNDYLNQLPSEK